MGRQSQGIPVAGYSSPRGIAVGATITAIKTETSTADQYINPSNLRHAPTACKAWVNFNGSGTVAIRGSYNVSSITDNGVGAYKVNFTNAMANANYAAVVGSNISSGYADTNFINSNEPSARPYNLLTGSCSLGTYFHVGGAGNGASDVGLATLAVFGEF